MADAISVAVRNGSLVGNATAQANQLGEQFATMGLPPYTESVRKGTAWQTMAVTAVAGLVVRPSTTAALEIWNGYQPAGASLVIDRVFAFNLVTTAANEGFSVWAQVTTVKAAPSSAALAIRGNSGKAYGGSVLTAINTTVTDSGWFPWTNGLVTSGAGVTPYGCAIANVEGRLIVPPGCSLCLHVVASLVGQTFTNGAGWFEETVTNA
jgi:hypothetical protein